MDKAGITSSADEQKELYRLFPTETARRLIGLMLQQAETVRRDIALRAGAQGVDAAYATSQAQDPTAKMKDFQAAWDSLLTALGAPLVAPATNALRYLAKEISNLTLMASQHPDGVRVIGEFTAAFGGLLVVSGSLKLMSVVLGPTAAGLRLLAGGVGMFATGTPAAAALTVLGGGLATVAGGLVALGAAVVGLPVLLKHITDMFPSGTPTGGRAAPAHVFGGGTTPAIHVTTHTYLDSRRIMTTKGVQSGTTQFDGSMHPYPAGAPAGGGN
jgi:hypothetical protein